MQKPSKGWYCTLLNCCVLIGELTVTQSRLVLLSRYSLLGVSVDYKIFLPAPPKSAWEKEVPSSKACQVRSPYDPAATKGLRTNSNE